MATDYNKTLYGVRLPGGGLTLFKKETDAKKYARTKDDINFIGKIKPSPPDRAEPHGLYEYTGKKLVHLGALWV